MEAQILDSFIWIMGQHAKFVLTIFEDEVSGSSFNLTWNDPIVLLNNGPKNDFNNYRLANIR